MKGLKMIVVALLMVHAFSKEVTEFGIFEAMRTSTQNEDQKAAGGTGSVPQQADILNYVLSSGDDTKAAGGTGSVPQQADILNYVLSSGDDKNSLPSTVYNSYKYLLTTSLEVSTSVSSALQNSFWISVLPQSPVPNSVDRHFIIVVDNHTDSQGGQEPGFNNSELQHQAIFQIFQDQTTGQASTIKISPNLPKKYLEVASQLIDRHFTPIFRHPKSLSLSHQSISVSNTTNETVTVLSANDPADNDKAGVGEYEVSICNEGIVCGSVVRYSVRSNSTKTICGNGNAIGLPIPPVQLNVHYNFNLREKSSSINQDYLTLINDTLNNDRSILAYSRAGFLSLMKGLRKQASDELSQQTSNFSPSPRNLRVEVSDDRTSSEQAEIKDYTTYQLVESRESLVQAPILSGSFRVTLLSIVNLLVVEGTANHNNNKADVNARLLFEFGSETKEVVVTNRVDYISKDYSDSQSSKHGTWDVSLPVHFGDGQISFDMRVQLNYIVTSRQSQTTVDGQLSMNRSLSILVNCSASYQTPDIGGIIGYAEFRGTVVNLQVSQKTVVGLNSSDTVSVDTLLEATLGSYKYKLFQRFARHACYRRTFLWVKKLVWCNWETAVDHWWTSNKPMKWETASKRTVAIQ